MIAVYNESRGSISGNIISVNLLLGGNVKMMTLSQRGTVYAQMLTILHGVGVSLGTPKVIS